MNLEHRLALAAAAAALLPAAPVAAAPSLTGAFAVARPQIAEPGWTRPMHAEQLVPLGGGRYALLAAGGQGDCRRCRGTLSVAYLSEAGGGLKLDAAFRRIWQGGAWGDIGVVSPAEVGASAPAIEIAGGYGAFGLTVEDLTIVELTPARPIVRLYVRTQVTDYTRKDAIKDSIFLLSDRVPMPGPGLALHVTGWCRGRVEVDKVVRYAGPGEWWSPDKALDPGICTPTAFDDPVTRMPPAR